MSTQYPPLGAHPTTRLRRTRADAWNRALVAEHRLTPSDLVWALFIREGENVREPVTTLPGVERLSVDLAVDACAEAARAGIPMVALFPVVDADLKSPDGREAWRRDNLIHRCVRAIKAEVSDLGIMCDVALDPYTSHGHDGLLKDGVVLNDESVEILTEMGLALAEAGADVLGPSDMMDGRIGAIRKALERRGFPSVRVLSYAAKYASSLYGPFRAAIGSQATLQGHKKTYQMDPANSDEALREVAFDLNEGADMVMVKPGLPYLDIIAKVKQAFGVPTLAYQVSGEYAMLAAAASNGWLDYRQVLLETLLAFKRAGADGVLTYAALDAAREIHRQQ
jgi:porphobilinogen synthase